MSEGSDLILIRLWDAQADVSLCLIYMENFYMLLSVDKYYVSLFSWFVIITIISDSGARWLSGRASDYRARGRGPKPTSTVLCP